MAEEVNMREDGHSAGAGETLGELERQIERGSMFMQASFDRLADRVTGAEAYVTELVETLRARGVLDDRDLTNPHGGDEASETEEREAATPSVEGPGLEDRPGDDVSPPPPLHWPAVALRVEGEELSEPVAVNCAERLHICHAVCCKLNLALTAEEVDAGKVRWDLGFPYFIRHNADGYCVHNDRETGGCSVYADRPGTCRRYSCANDRRIWKDFEGMELNSEWLDAHLATDVRIRLHTNFPSMEDPAAPGGTEME